LISIPIEPGEPLKTLEQVTRLTKRLNDQYDIAEQSLMFVIGGGTVCNFAGYVATPWQGMEIIVIPTNFTAIGDVAIGSLHLINLGPHKNKLQLCFDPLAVILDPKFMNTLPKSERRNGLAETVKHAIAQDAKLFSDLEAHIKTGTIFNDDILFDFALCTAQLKDKLMGIDPFGERTQSIFLYGHALAHAIEPATDFQMPHGEAVALGLLGELAFFHKPNAPIYVRTKAMLEGLGLPTHLPRSLLIDTIMNHLEHVSTDKGLSIAYVNEPGNLCEESGTVRRFFTPDAVRATLTTIAS
jgi:3-dehydroquinate synthase